MNDQNSQKFMKNTKMYIKNRKFKNKKIYKRYPLKSYLHTYFTVRYYNIITI